MGALLRTDVLFALAAILTASGHAAADTLKIERTDPPKSFRFLRGADPVPIEVTVKYKVDVPNGGEIAVGVHDQRDRPLMMLPMPIATIKQGSDSVIFKATIKSLDSDVKEVIVEAVLLSAIRSPRRPAPGEAWRAKVTYKVR